jgi:hypothetical protein
MLLTADTTLTIADRSVLSEHAELHHYTTYAAVKGIYETNTLWATHFSDLNDATEVTHLQAPLLEAVVARFVQILDERKAHLSGSQSDFESQLAASLAKPGGAEMVARAAATDIVQALYKFTFENKAAFPFAEPFIASFCSHSSDQAYERENGLLSQWRGYGRDGGFCIVLDTAALAGMLGREFDALLDPYESRCRPVCAGRHIRRRDFSFASRSLRNSLFGHFGWQGPGSFG